MANSESEHFNKFFREMIRHNMNVDKMAIDLSVVPREVLEQILHFILMVQVLQSSEEIDIDIAIGPDENYQHAIHGLSVESSDSFIHTFLVDRHWYIVYAWDNTVVAELLVAKLIENEWEPVDETDDGFWEAIKKVEHTLGIKGIAAIMQEDL